MFGELFVTDNIHPMIETGKYTLSLVLLSYAIACFGSFVGIRMAMDLCLAQGRRRNWLHLQGAVAFGIGIWSMHFVGMLAYNTNIVHEYDPLLTSLSLIIAVLLAAGMLSFIRSGTLELKKLVPSAVLFGAAICGMHYTGMYAMKMDADIKFHPVLFFSSVCIAIGASAAALIIIFILIRYQGFKKNALVIAAAMIMGLAVCGMHYTGMAATVIIPYADCRYSDSQDFFNIATLIAILNLSIYVLYIHHSHRRIFSLLGVGALFALPFFLIVHEAVIRTSEEMSYLKSQKSLFYVHRTLLHELTIVTELRGLENMAASGEESVKPRIRDLKTKLVSMIVKADENADSKKADDILKSVNKEVLELITLDSQIDPKDLFIAFTEKNDRIMKELSVIGDESHLNLNNKHEDPLSREIIMLTPDIIASIGDLRGRLSGYLVGEPSALWGREKLDHILWLKHKLFYFEDPFKILIEQDKTIYAEFYRENILPGSDTFRRNIETAVAGNPDGIKPIQFFDQATATLYAYRDLYDVAMKDYEGLQGEVYEETEYQSRLILYSSLLACIGFLSLFIFLYRSLEETEKGRQDLKRQTLFLDTLLDNMPLSIFAKDINKEYRYVLANRQALQMTGLERDKAIGKTDYDLFPIDIADVYRESDKQAVEKEGVIEVDQEPVLTPNGAIIAHTVKIPIRDEQNNFSILLGILEDVTAKVQAQEALKEAKNAAEMASMAKTEFLANMSHEIRTPLNSILGMSFLLKESDLSAEQQEMLGSVVRSSENLLGIVNDILDLSKIESRSVVLESIPFNIMETIRHAGQSILPIASAKGISVMQEVPDAPLYVLGDPLRFSRILNNLLGNAVRYTETGYIRIEVKSTLQDSGNIRLRCAIQDTGIGIAPDRIRKIFEKFTQEDSSTTRRFGGTGLGLSIVKELLDLMGGIISVESTKNVGTTFTVVVSFKPSSEEDYNRRLDKEDYKFSHIAPVLDRDANILVAEDHVINQLLIKKILARFDLKNFKIVENGIEVLREVKTGKYDLVLMDCHMPLMSGYEATTNIRKIPDEKISKIPVIAMTANAMPGEREKCLSIGMDEYIAKPIDIGCFRRLLSLWIDLGDGVGEESVYAAPVASSDAPVDLSSLKENSMGDDAFFLEMIDMFVKQAEKQIKDLRNACKNGKDEDWVEISHSLKGSAASVGANDLRALCADAQNMPDATQAARSEILSKIENSYALVKDYLIWQKLYG